MPNKPILVLFALNMQKKMFVCGGKLTKMYILSVSLEYFNYIYHF